MATDIQYYNFLTRTQHPVFRKSFTGEPLPNDSFHLVRNYLVAKQLIKIMAKVKSLEENSFPHTVNIDGIAEWEMDYFGFTKSTLPLEQRRYELITWINSNIGMALVDVINAAISITGKEPLVILNVNKGGWTLGKTPLGVKTIMAGDDTTPNRYTYLVKFNEIISSSLIKTFDKELTRIEKAGSKHIISALKIKWILGKSSLGVDTILRN